MRLRASDADIFRQAIDCLEAARDGMDYMVTDHDRWAEIIERLQMFCDEASIEEIGP